jgi:hypothetical protein
MSVHDATGCSPLRPADGVPRLERPNRPYTLAEVDGASDKGSEWWEGDEGVVLVDAPPELPATNGWWPG